MGSAYEQGVAAYTEDPYPNPGPHGTRVLKKSDRG